MQIVLNGEPRTVKQGETVQDILNQLGIPPERVAIELNRAILRKPAWGATVLEAGAELEVVQFVGGG